MTKEQIKAHIELENRLYRIFGFSPCLWSIESLEFMYNCPSANDAEKFLKEKCPYEWFRYLGFKWKSELQVNDYVLTLKAGFASNQGGMVLKVYEIKGNLIYLCSLSCKDPFNEKECEPGDRFCISKEEAFDKVLYLRNFDIYYKRYLKRYKTV